MKRPRDMKYIHLAEVGVWELGQMVLNGELSPDKAWVAMKGAAEYLKAAAAGDIAYGPIAQERMEKCMACPLSTRTKGSSAPGPSLWCGTKFKPSKTKAGSTCGCLLGVTVDGADYPAGKTVVASETCPSGKW